MLKGWAIQERTSNPVYAPTPRGNGEKGALARNSPARRPDTEVQIAHQTRTGSTGQGILMRSLRYSHAGSQKIFHRHIKLPKPRSNATRRGPVDSSLETSSAKGFFALTVAQMTLLAGYFALVMICIFNDSELDSNANRPGELGSSHKSWTDRSLTCQSDYILVWRRFPGACHAHASLPPRNQKLSPLRPDRVIVHISQLGSSLGRQTPLADRFHPWHLMDRLLRAVRFRCHKPGKC